jgi:hypothetical protein
MRSLRFFPCTYFTSKNFSRTLIGKENFILDNKDYREQGLIEPVGRAITNAGLSYFYHPKQIKQLQSLLKEIKSKKQKKQ